MSKQMISRVYSIYSYYGILSVEHALCFVIDNMIVVVIPRWFTQADKSNNKAHTVMIKLAMYSNIYLALILSPTSLV